ncbi:MAG: hypothetical protein HW421_2701 [Ignavibacteria bacterium]|nr:hypothetical protein [Ignavibacteria bacterium]
MENEIVDQNEFLISAAINLLVDKFGPECVLLLASLPEKKILEEMQKNPVCQAYIEEEVIIYEVFFEN